MADLTPVLIDAPTQRENIRTKVVQGLKSLFPLETKNYTVHLDNIKLNPVRFSSREQKQAILEGRTLQEPIKGNLTVKDKTGKVTSEIKNFTLVHLPYFTERHTFIVDGNEYNVANQIRIKPGVYTRRRANAELEAAFNLSHGSNFRLSMDPEKARFFMEYGTTNIPLYPILRALGVPHTDIAGHWGNEVADMNKATAKDEDKHINKLYEKLIPPSRQKAQTREEKIQALHDYYQNTAMDPEVTKKTLGTAFDKVTPMSLLAASKKLLDVHKKDVDTDDRDSLEFKTFYSVDDFLKERILLDSRTLKHKFGIKLDAAKGEVRRAIPSAPFTRSVKGFITTAALSAVPTEINPLELIDHAVKITSLGEGGIQTERAIPLEARNLHPTQFAVMDPARTPESFKAGIDIRAAINTKRDAKGNLYTPLKNVSTGKVEHLTPADILEKVVAFPGEDLGPGKMVDVMHRGEIKSMPASKVDYIVPHISNMYAPTTNLLPMVEGMQGNRVLMASKHQTQALPLVDREVPNVQVASPRKGKSMEEEIVRLIVPTSPVDGTITKIDKDYIYIKPHNNKSAEECFFADDEIYSDFIDLISAKKVIEKVAVVLMHVSGPSGSGKSTLLTNMQKQYPNLIAKDLDEFDDEASEKLYPGIKKQEYTGDMIRELALQRQALMDSFLARNEELPVLLAGHHTEGDTVLNIPTKQRYMLDTGPLRSVWRAYQRSKTEAPQYRRHLSELPADYKDAKNVEKQLLSLGYIPTKVEDIEEKIKNSLSTYKQASKDEDLIRLHYDTNFPMASKTYLHNMIKVKEGDTVKAGQPLADSNFTKHDTLALGKNLKIAYMAYRGLNSNDGIVISEDAATKLTSEHMYKYILQLESDLTLDREKHRTYFGTKHTPAQYNKLEEDGTIKPGTKVDPEDILIAGVRKTELTAESALLGRLSKALIKPYKEETVVWDHDTPGEVIDVVKTNTRITVTVKTREPIQIGDKIVGRFANKGVVSKILPNDQMIQDEGGKPIDVLFTSAGIITRINPNQVIEASLGKVAAKTGKPIVVENYANRNNIQFAKDLMKEHGIKDKETVFDPVTNKKIPNIFVGNSYIMKLFKTTETNWSAHGVKNYDLNFQPARGGEEGAKALGKMEFDGLVAHNARNILREAAAIKSNRNDEFWRAIQLGLPTPAPKSSFAYDKFLNMLHGAGIKVDKSNTSLSLGPLTDSDIKRLSAGEIKDSKFLRAKDLMPEPEGFFDPVVTGGTSGTKWSHIALTEPIVNPVFEEPVRRLLGMTKKEFSDTHAEKGGAYFRRELNKIDVAKRIKELRDETKKLKGSALDNAVKQIKYLSALKEQKLDAGNAYVLSVVPVVPPIIRPILPGKSGDLQISDVNHLYKDAFLANKEFKEAKAILPDNELNALRNHLYESVGAVFGTHDPVSPSAQKRQAKGLITMIAGTTPGSGFFQDKLMSRQQDVSGRATIIPEPQLNLDEVGIPENMLWVMLEKFLIGRLVKQGYSAVDAKKMVEDRHPAARNAFALEVKERPVFVNRAPSLHRFNVVAAYPVPVQGKSVKLNPFAEKGMNADYDGDAVQIHAPVTPAGIKDAENMTLSKLLFLDKSKNALNVAPDHEAIIGLHRATDTKSPGKTHNFKTRGEAIEAYHRGEVGLGDSVKIQELD